MKAEPHQLTQRAPSGLGHWLRRLFVPRATPGWLIISVRTPEVRFPIFVPLPVGWVRDIVRGARLSLAAADRASGGRINHRIMRYVPPSVDWYTADLDLDSTLPGLLYGIERVMDELLAGKSYTLAEVDYEDTRVFIRIV